LCAASNAFVIFLLLRQWYDPGTKPETSGQPSASHQLRTYFVCLFAEQLRECGIEDCLPGVGGDVEEGVRIYRSFGTFTGASYAEVEAMSGAIAIDVEPLRPAL